MREIAGSIQLASPSFRRYFLGGSRRFDFGSQTRDACDRAAGGMAVAGILANCGCLDKPPKGSSFLIPPGRFLMASSNLGQALLALSPVSVAKRRARVP